MLGFSCGTLRARRLETKVGRVIVDEELKGGRRRRKVTG